MRRFSSVAPSLGVELTALNAQDAGEIERAVTEFARAPNSGLIVTGGAPIVSHRELIAALAARHRLPAVYFRRTMVDSGGLISYGSDLLNQYRHAARIRRPHPQGREADYLPVQAPTKYELTINLKTAKAVGLEVPPTLLALADGVIE